MGDYWLYRLRRFVTQAIDQGVQTCCGILARALFAYMYWIGDKTSAQCGQSGNYFRCETLPRIDILQFQRTIVQLRTLLPRSRMCRTLELSAPSHVSAHFGLWKRLCCHSCAAPTSSLPKPEAYEPRLSVHCQRPKTQSIEGESYDEPTVHVHCPVRSERNAAHNRWNQARLCP